MGTTHPVILFDGVCNLCTGSVQFIIRHDPKSVFHFAALQSEYGTRQLRDLNIPSGEFNTLILISDKVYQKSDAVLEITRHLSGAWPALYILKIVPPFFRNWMYDLISQSRYRFFGRKDHCLIPAPELKSRFIGE
jgi:predicted DCC family thiol-disulfide oxidoreductase YuxK